MTSAHALGVGLIGIGPASQPHIRAISELDGDVVIRGVLSRNRDKLAAFCAEHRLPAAADLDSLLGDAAVDALVILTPPDARKPIVEAAAAAGKHILMEKPVERTTAAAQCMVDLCERAGVRLGVVFQHRFRESSIKARELLKSEVMGVIRAVRLLLPWWRPQSYYDQPGRGTFARDGGGVLISQAIHSLDLLLELAGPVREVQAIAGTTALHRMEAEDFVAGGLRFASGAIGALMATTASYPGATERLGFDCDKAAVTLAGGRLEVNWHDGRREVFGSDVSTGAGFDPMAFPHEWHRELYRDFADAVRTGRPPQSNGRTALGVHRLIDALLASSRSGHATIVEVAG